MMRIQHTQIARISALLISVTLLLACGCSDTPEEKPVDPAVARRAEVAKLLKDIPGDPYTQTPTHVRQLRMALTRSEELLILDPTDAKAKGFKQTATRLLLANRKPAQLLTSITTMPSSVMSVRFSADGLTAITTHTDSTARHWNLSSRECVKTLSGAKEHQPDALVSADGLYRIAFSDEDTFGLYDIASKKCVRTFAGHTGGTTHAAFSPDGRAILTSGNDNAVKLWWMGRDGSWKVIPEVAPPVSKTINKAPAAVAGTPRPTTPVKEEKAPVLTGVKLQSTLMGRFSTAIINGRRVRVGDIISGWKITKIGSGYIELQWKEKMHVLYRDMSPTTPGRRR